MKTWRGGLAFVLAGALLLPVMWGCTVGGGEYSGPDRTGWSSDSGRTGATMLEGDIGDFGQLLVYMGFNSYADSGGLSYYDDLDGLLKDTGVSVDVGDFVIHHEGPAKTLYFTNSPWSGTSGTFYVEMEGSPSGWEQVELNQQDGSSFAGSAVLLDDTGGTVYVLDPGDYSGNNALYLIDTSTREVGKTDLTISDRAFTCMAQYNNELYYSDTNQGDIYKSDMTGEGLVHVTTTAVAAGPLYFVEDKGYVLCGVPWSGGGEPGVHVFDPLDEKISIARHCTNSGDLSAQYMAVKDANTAYLTTWSSGVFVFDPAHAWSSPDTASFSLILGTDDTSSYQDAYYDEVNGDLFVAVNSGGGLGDLVRISNP
jgi:hypothetical protein